VAQLPGSLDQTRHRDMQGRERHPWYRRALMGLIAVIPVVALFNVFGQRAISSHASVPAATFAVDAPEHLRGGLIYQARFDITARRQIAHPTLVLAKGWWDGMSVNSIEPNPSTESTQNGKVTLSFDTLQAGESLTVWIYFQANPTHVGRGDQTAELADGTTPIARIQRKVTAFP
jgi:hypothetical protein